MKRFLLAAFAVATCGLLFAQNSGLDEPDAENIGNDSAMESLREISVDKFEREGSWRVSISPDNGVISCRLFDGKPAMYEPLEDEKGGKNDEAADNGEGENADNEGGNAEGAEGNETADNGEGEEAPEQVLGVKVEFFKRGINSFFIMSQRPLPIEGITKTVSVWVCGRNQSHDMYVLVQDYFGKNFELYIGNLGFTGWKKLTAVVPPSPDGERGIVQHSAYYGDRPGLRVLGFRVDCDPMLARGQFFMYLDELHAVTDLYDMENKDEDDMLDNW